MRPPRLQDQERVQEIRREVDGTGYTSIITIIIIFKLIGTFAIIFTSFGLKISNNLPQPNQITNTIKMFTKFFFYNNSGSFSSIAS